MKVFITEVIVAAKLTVLTDTIITTLNTAPNGTWSDHTVGIGVNDFVKATPVIDPENFFEGKKTGLFVVPVTMLYNRSASGGRRRIVKLQKSPVIAICLSYRFPDHDPTGVDVSPWDEVKRLLNLREEIDEYLLTREWDWNITGITAEPAQEIPLKARWYLSVTEIEFEGFACGTWY